MVIYKGRCYFISTNLNVKDSGIDLKTTDYDATIFDGEYIFITPFDSQSESFSNVITQSEIGVMNEKRPNNYSIKPKKGSVLIFPVSIHFLYTENIKLFESKYIIEGYLYL